MPTIVNVRNIEELAHKSTPEEIIIRTGRSTVIHIVRVNNETTAVKLLSGNKFDIVNDVILIKDK